MSKMIKPTEEYLAKCKLEFEKLVDEQIEKMRNSKLLDGKMSFSAVLEDTKQKAVVKFTTVAWVKMNSLVESFDKEIAWHGLAKRGDEENEYVIYDILVYPQEVTGASVDTDQEEYQTWLMEFDDDVFFNIRMQGHSHVNMGVSPSSTDLGHQDKIIQQLQDNMFYIFLIWNKKGDHHIRIYDMETNTYFESSDISVDVIPDDTGLLDFIKNAKEKVKEKGLSVVKKDKENDKKSEEKTKDKPSIEKDYTYYGYDDYYDYDDSYFSKYKRNRRW